MRGWGSSGSPGALGKVAIGAPCGAGVALLVLVLVLVLVLDDLILPLLHHSHGTLARQVGGYSGDGV